MSKKTLLNENTIRRFWKLASIRPLNEMEYLREEDPEDEEGELPGPALEEPPMEAPLDDLGAEEAPLDDLGAEEAPAGEIEAEVNVAAEDVPSLETAVDILQKILAVAGEGEGESELDDEDAPVDDLAAPVDDLGAEEVPSPLGENNEENLEENDLDPTRLEEVLKKITDRVTKRILRASLVNKINKK